MSRCLLFGRYKHTFAGSFIVVKCNPLKRTGLDKRFLVSNFIVSEKCYIEFLLPFSFQDSHISTINCKTKETNLRKKIVKEKN